MPHMEEWKSSKLFFCYGVKDADRGNVNPCALTSKGKYLHPREQIGGLTEQPVIARDNWFQRRRTKDQSEAATRTVAKTLTVLVRLPTTRTFSCIGSLIMVGSGSWA